MMRRRILTVLLAGVLLLSCFTGAAGAAEPETVNWQELTLFLGASDSAAFVRPQQDRGAWALFLPAGEKALSSVFCTLPDGVSSVTAVNQNDARCELRDGAAAELGALLDDGVTKLTLIAETEPGGAQTAELSVFRSGVIDALFFQSSDPVEHGRAWVEASPTKENKAGGAMVMLDPEGRLSHADPVEAIKGRGNTTWEMVKKPYQIKLVKKDDLLDSGSSNNKAKKWLLIANCADESLLRNRLALGLGHGLGMEFNVEFKPIDLFYDGEYRGSYLLTEKVEIGKGRVNIYDLEEQNETENAGVSLETLPVMTGKTENGAYYRYCDGMKTPADYKRGYLLEMEMSYRLQDEVCWVQTRRGNNIVVKSPEFCSREEMEYIADWYQQYEDACYSDDGQNPDSGRRYTEYVELRSTVQCFLVNELSKNNDGFLSSAYIYIASENEPAKMGPLWDYDLGFGREIGEAVLNSHVLFQNEPTGFYHLYNIFVNNWYRQADFRAEVCAQYADMYELIQEIILGGETQSVGCLSSISGMRKQLAASRACNAELWGDGYETAETDEMIDHVQSYICVRAEDLKERFALWETSVPEIGVFFDVPVKSWYAKEVTEAAKQGIVHGTSPQFYSPGKLATRRNFVQMLYNMMAPGTVDTTTPFTDVSAKDGGAVAICWAAAQGIARGYPDGTFHPGSSITRAELVTFLHRMFGEPEAEEGATAQFTDANTIPAYARKAMAWAIQAGIIRGYGNGTVLPKANTTRAELAVIMLRAYNWKNENP